jgi:hypothetical protein
VNPDVACSQNFCDRSSEGLMVCPMIHESISGSDCSFPAQKMRRFPGKTHIDSIVPLTKGSLVTDAKIWVMNSHHPSIFEICPARFFRQPRMDKQNCVGDDRSF